MRTTTKNNKGNYPYVPGVGDQNKQPFRGEDFAYDKNLTGFNRQGEKYQQSYTIMGRERAVTQKAKMPGDLQK